MGKWKGDDFNAIKCLEKYFLHVSCYMLSWLCVTIDVVCIFLYCTGQFWRKRIQMWFRTGQLLVDGDVCAREKELKFKNVPQYFAGLYLGTHRSNQIYPTC